MRLGIAVVSTALACVALRADTRPSHADELRPRPHVVRVPHRVAGDAPTLGRADALVTFELFAVGGAPVGRAAYDTLRQLHANHPSRVRVVFRLLMRQAQLLLPEAAAEAHAQGKFFEFMTAVYRSQRQPMKREQILETAEQVGLDIRRLEAAWADGRHEATLAANESRRQRLQGKNLPDLVVNGVVVERPSTTLSIDEAEAMYGEAYERALDLLDRGVPRAHLGAAFEAKARARKADVALAPGPIDDPDPSDPLDGPPVLTKVPLDTRGWPSLGPADAAVPIIVLCNLRSLSCRTQILNIARRMRDVFDDEVRVIWAPMFDPAGDDAAATTLINDAALCAEELGAGWSWVEHALAAAYRRHGRPGNPDREIDAVIAATELDRNAVARCLASSAGASARSVGRSRAAGVKSGPTIVVGGRIYLGGFTDFRTLQRIVENELAPGVLGTLAPDYKAMARPAN